MNVDPPSRSCSNALASLDVGIKTMVISESGRYHNDNMHRKTQINIEMVRSKTNEDNSDIRHQQHNKMIKDIQITVLSQLCGRMSLTEYGLVTKVSILCAYKSRRNYFRNAHSVLQVHFFKNSGKWKNMRTST